MFYKVCMGIIFFFCTSNPQVALVFVSMQGAGSIRQLFHAVREDSKPAATQVSAGVDSWGGFKSFQYPKGPRTQIIGL